MVLTTRPAHARKPRMMNFSVYWNYQSKIAEVAINQVSEEDPHRLLPHHPKLNLSLRDHYPNHSNSLLPPHQLHLHENLPLPH
jgi:hypothetical protein